MTSEEAPQTVHQLHAAVQKRLLQSMLDCPSDKPTRMDHLATSYAKIMDNKPGKNPGEPQLY